MGGDERVRAVLKRAAEDPDYFALLMSDREGALAGLHLSPEERVMLTAASREQLSKMIGECRRGKLRNWAGVAAAAGLAAGVAVIGGGMLLAVTATAGISPHAEPAFRARAVIRNISLAEKVYHTNCGEYGTIEDLVRAEYLDMGDAAEHDYAYEVTVEGESFSATAHHKKRPKTRPAFRVGPDGEVDVVTDE
jgi:hypothetical protein